MQAKPQRGLKQQKHNKTRQQMLARACNQRDFTKKHRLWKIDGHPVWSNQGGWENPSKLGVSTRSPKSDPWSLHGLELTIFAMAVIYSGDY